MGGSRLSVCELSALGQSCQFSVTLDRRFTLIMLTEFGIKERRGGWEEGVRCMHRLQ